MKNNLLKILSIVAAISMFAASCKKDKDAEPEKKYTLIRMVDSTQGQNINIDYDNQGRILRFGLSTSLNFDYYYNGNNISVRTQKNNNTVSKTDSFFYDASARIVRMESYDENMVKISTYTFGYNGDNSLNTINIDIVDPGDADLLYEYTYANGNVALRTEKKKVLGVYKKSLELEFLGTDSKANPFENLYKKYFYDQIYLFYFLWNGKNNATTAKQTTYDTSTGDIIEVSTATTTYTYNEDELPTSSTTIYGGTTQILSYIYEVE